ncbi:hypothetical protein A2617_03500 [Candidatus Daviesbacteria bacterium RIFOXYD1_FULL_41_10]|uniref:Uncharacterized protein n=2 Tax=Candidatus Daviesiibacteriota TaxID=1752718 RepID=A0A1F5N0Q1_9BACT|nr:MAG: hypothetical protein UU67_C0008G0012 [Candidatus Daviesbacteria bacterium GW2011_GWB1_41_5]OGE71216.1 MAG: hypothetical protein A2617_03500 [Candidatus Daviesbacteria bacterium RIFOXYD1_FULL_41_10]
MLIFKKLIFAIPFLLSFALFSSQAVLFLQDPSNILSFDTETLSQNLIFATSLLLSGILFVIFATLASDWKLIIPVSAIASASVLISFPSQDQLGYIVSSGALASFLITDLFLSQRLSSYLTFQAAAIVMPSVKHITTLLILVLSFAFYTQSSYQIKTQGFTLPPSVIDTTFNLLLGQNIEGNAEPGLQQISPEQAELVRPMVEPQVQALIKPYLKYVPIILSVLFFFSLQTLITLLNLPVGLLVRLLFWILEKIGFISFIQLEVPQQEAKKLVV